MTEQPPTLNEENILWEEATSKNGKPFRIGRKKTENSTTEGKGEENVTDKTDFGIQVTWPVGANSWNTTTSDVQKTAAITRYILYNTSGQNNYRLYFTDTEYYWYYFYDQTGDSYNVNTFRDTDHYVDYTSNKPNILFITGS
jgi:hypothetical protein